MTALLMSGLGSAQMDVNQPQDWANRLQRALERQALMLFPLSSMPRRGVDGPEVMKAASGKAAAALKGAALTEEKLYQGQVFWARCGLDGLYRVQFDVISNAMRRMGYVPVIVDTAERVRTVLWRDSGKVRPSVVTLVDASCGENDTVLLSVFQVGDMKHLAYWKPVADRALYPRGEGATALTVAGVQLRTPTTPTTPISGDSVLVELFNSTGQDRTVTLKVDVRNREGRIINSYSESAGIVKANSPLQTVVKMIGLGANDVVVSIENVR